ncbi:DoxX family protein [Catenuloplanes japonicus]|uniref:DoxX family protein n=1 Tax=Catenuloplanes japonicus TaxID=33876 RepID=UPI0005258451|nr:DoxX family protein [Catenuloplanes japonicus]
MFVVTVVLSCLVAAAFMFSGARKVAGGSDVAGEAVHLGVPVGGYRALGVVESAGAAGLLIGLAWAALGIAAAAGLVVLMLGAAFSHLRVGDRAARWTPAAGLGVLAAATLVARVVTA